MKWLSRMFPWPGKRERAAAITAAKAEHRQSRANADQSRTVRQQIIHLARANGYAAAIEEQIIRGHEKR